MNLRRVLRHIGIHLSARSSEIDEAYDDNVAHTMDNHRQVVEGVAQSASEALSKSVGLSRVIQQAKKTYVAALHGHDGPPIWTKPPTIF